MSIGPAELLSLALLLLLPILVVLGVMARVRRPRSKDTAAQEQRIARLEQRVQELERDHTR